MTTTNEAPKFCSRCGIPLGEGAHERPQECIDALRLGLKRQAEAAEGLAFEVSTRFFGILEGLAHDPEIAGVRFHTHNHDTGEKRELPREVVCGVMTAILREYQKAGRWSPLADAKEQARKNGTHAYDLFSVLNSLWSIVNDADADDNIPPVLREKVESVLEAAKQHGVHLLGQRRS
jgi:hypothetical protein